jgi:signal transduction histidine kinase
MGAGTSTGAVTYDREVEVIESATPRSDEPDRGLPVEPSIMLGAGVAVFLVALAVAYRPSFAGQVDVALAVLPWIVGAGLLVSLGHWTSDAGRWIATLLALAAWLGLVADDPRWSVLAFVAFALCYEVPAPQPTVGLVMATVVTLAWVLAWWIADPGWIAAVPVAVFLGSAAIAGLLTHERRLVEEQADLITRLQDAQAELATSERTRGVLEERARMAGEIHDTLAQGFASIVLLCRSAQRNAPATDALPEIEAEAQTNLDTARRLVAATGPAELASVSLPAAIERTVAATVDGQIAWRFELVGEPRPLPGDTDVTMLRGAQEAVANATTHAKATSITVVLSYGTDTIDLEVTDDGTGFRDGEIADRGTLTGGQGLRLLAERAAILGGRLHVDGVRGTGTTVSLTLPGGGP